MKPPAFDYHAPASLDEAVRLLAELGEDAKVIAGGQSLVPMLALRLAAVDHLVDLRNVPDLRGIQPGEAALSVGAATTQAELGRSAEIAGQVPLLARATPLIGHFQIRNRGTLGGSLAHNDAAAEYPAVALALDAELHAYSPRGARTIPAQRFFTGLWSTDLAADEILTAVTFPIRGEHCGYAIEEFARRHGDFAIAGAAVAVQLDSRQRISRCGIGLFGLGPTAHRATEVEAKLTGTTATGTVADDIGHAAMTALPSVPGDQHAPAAYRTRLGAALVARAWQRAVQEATDA